MGSRLRHAPDVDQVKDQLVDVGSRKAHQRCHSDPTDGPTNVTLERTRESPISLPEVQMDLLSG